MGEPSPPAPSVGGAGDLNQRLRRLPKVDEVLRRDAARHLLERAPRWAVVAAVRDEIEALRARLIQGEETPEVSAPALSRRVDDLLRPSLRRVLNATGVVLHTNLGRAPLARPALDRLVEIAAGYCNLEYAVAARRRGSRHDHLAHLLAQVTGCEAALVVNNCAAAVLVALAALAAGRQVIVSRGELVEIGGSFRVPDVMRASGAELVEVGTTNRTHLGDYERAITDRTALLLKVHQSNFAQVGFTASVSVEELAELGRSRGVLTMVDLGSGSLVDLAARSSGRLEAEPTVQQVIAAGADVVTCSGDKLLGGPQAGLLLLRAALRDRVKSHPLVRAVRTSKLELAALEATLELYRDGRADEIPAVALLTADHEALAARAAKLQLLAAASAPALSFEVIEVRSAVGGGALPRSEPASFAVAASHPALSAEALDARLRTADPPLVTRTEGGRLLADVRTLSDEDLPLAAAAFAHAARDDHHNSDEGRP